MIFKQLAFSADGIINSVSGVVIIEAADVFGRAFFASVFYDFAKNISGVLQLHFFHFIAIFQITEVLLFRFP